MSKLFKYPKPDTDAPDPYMSELTERIPSRLFSYHDNRKYLLYLLAMVFVPTTLLTGLWLLPMSQTSFLFAASILTGVWSTYWGYIGHDFAHNTGFENQTLNKVMAHISWGIVGYGYSVWDYNHNKVHHVTRKETDEIKYCEISDSPWPNILVPVRTWLKNVLQVIPAPLAFALAKRTRDSYLSLVLGWSSHAIRVLAFYILSEGDWTLTALALAVHIAAASAYFVLSFAIGHANSSLMFYEDTPTPWTKYQLNGTQSILGGTCTSLIMGLCLKHQIEHHLFPGVLPFNYSEMRGIVRDFASEKPDLIYTENSLYEAVFDMCFRKRFAGKRL